MAEEHEVREFYERNLSTGSKIAGGLLGAAASLALHTPFAGPMLAPIVASGIERVGRDVIARRLSARQEERVGLAVVLAMRRIVERRTAGEALRTDGFFDEHHAGRAPADEVTEHALNAAMAAMEERKIPFLANMLANIAFDDHIALAEAHLLFRTAEDASYLQFAIMRAIAPASAPSFASRGNGDKPAVPDGLYAISAEIYRLFGAGLVEMRVDEDNTDSIAFLSPADADPGLLRFTALGRRLYDLAGLADMAKADTTLIGAREALHLLGAYGSGVSIDGGVI